MEVASVFFRHSSRSRFRGDHASLIELLLFVALVLVVVMLAFDSVSWRVFAFFHDLINTAH
jgi:hypothetical protein